MTDQPKAALPDKPNGSADATVSGDQGNRDAAETTDQKIARLEREKAEAKVAANKAAADIENERKLRLSHEQKNRDLTFPSLIRSQGRI